MVASSGVRRRLRAKTPPPPQPVQRALPEPLQLEQEAANTMKRKVYLITFPHTRQSANAAGLLLIAPGTSSKEQLAEQIKDAFANPSYTNVWFSGDAVLLVRFS